MRNSADPSARLIPTSRGSGAAMNRAARTGLAESISEAREGYDRARMLPRLIALDLRELERPSGELDAHHRRRLERALRAERARGRSAHWTYDINRHLALLHALAAERARKTPPDSAGRRSERHEMDPLRQERLTIDAYLRLPRCWPRPIFLASSERAAA